MSDKLYSQLKKHYNNAFVIEPTHFRHQRLDAIYKSLAPYLKRFPFRIFVPASLLLSILMFIFLGYMTIKIVSLLQYGF